MLRAIQSKTLSNLTNKDNWLSIFAGLSLVFAYAPFSLWWLPFIVLPLWFSNIDQTSIKQASKQGGIFALGWFISGISWVHVSIAEFGGMPLVVSIALMLLLCLYLSVFSALACYCCAKFTTNKQFNLWLFPAFWLLAEYLRGWFLTGFPWLSLGYSQIDGPLSVLAPLIGEVGITFSLLIFCVALYKLATKQNIIFHSSLIFIIACSCLLLSNKSWVELTGKKIKVALVQGNIQQSLKWQPEQEWPTMLKYLDLTRVNYDADLIIWPESAIPSMEPLAQDFLQSVNKSAHFNNASIITGIINYNFESKEYFNSLIVLGKKSKADEEGSYQYESSNRYYKNHLLPIGEFVPFGDLLRPLAPFFNLPMSSFSRGDYVQENLVAQDLKLLPLICFEIVFPAQLAANYQADTNMLLTVSNDAWFGNSHGPHQHMEIARMRSLEFGRPLLRSTNNGITAVTDHLGQITAKIPQFEEAVLKADVALVKGNTPYSKWWQIIHWFMPISLLLIVYITSRRNKNK